jgi:hypothetical protein
MVIPALHNDFGSSRQSLTFSFALITGIHMFMCIYIIKIQSTCLTFSWHRIGFWYLCYDCDNTVTSMLASMVSLVPRVFAKCEQKKMGHFAAAHGTLFALWKGSEVFILL